MSAGMPELGSKISLISKADIRYEGRLFTVDPQECTIALSNVRSFGTEDREASFHVAPQSQIYDYILFRGSDIKDIRVVHNNPIPNDPAIVTLSVPSAMSNSSFQGQGQPSSQSGGFGGSQFGSYMPSLNLGMPSRALASELNNSSEPCAAADLPKQPPVARPPPPAKEQADLISGQQQQQRSSGNTTPIPRMSPTVNQGTQASLPAGGRQGGQQQQQHQQGGKPNSRGGRNMQQERPNQQGGDQRNNFNRNRQPQQQGGWGQNSAWQHPNQQMRQHQQQQQDGWAGLRGGWQQRRGRGRGGNLPRPPGMPGPPQGLMQQQPRGPQQPSTNNQGGQQKKHVLKFEGDYDFEQANTEFENLRSQLANIKLTATAAGDSLLPSTEVPVKLDEKKEVDSGNETGQGEGEAEEEVYYDKAKSFFDNISCEAIERSKGCSQRTDWRVERKLNSETFGVASTRRGYHRGRGGYYRGNMYRGGGGGGYRGGFRGSRGIYRNPQQQSGNPQGSPGQPAPNRGPPVSVGGK